MSYQTTPTNEITITLFQNTTKKNPKGPDAAGKVVFPDGTEYEVALWNRVSKNGLAYQGGVLRVPNPEFQKQEDQRSSYQRPAPAAKSNEVEVDF